MKIVIFGNGYLGSNIYKYFEPKSEVFIISNSLRNRNISNSIPFVEFNKYEQNFYNTDLLILANGLPSEICDYDLVKGIEFNLLNTNIIIEKFISFNCKRIIFFSSIHVYGDSLQGILTENNICNPTTPYKYNKLYMELALKNISNLHKNVSILVLRLSNVYGYINDSKLVNWDLFINLFAKNISLNQELLINSNGNSYRNVIHIKNLCMIIDFLNFNYFSRYDIINIGSELNLSLLSYFNFLTSSVNRNHLKLIVNKNDKTIHLPFVFDLTKINSILNKNLEIDETRSLSFFIKKVCENES